MTAMLLIRFPLRRILPGLGWVGGLLLLACGRTKGVEGTFGEETHLEAA